jgi:hypothetical protein
VINRVISELKKEGEQHESINSGGQGGFGFRSSGIGSRFGGLSQDDGNGGMMNEEDGNIIEILPNLKKIWERKF